MHEPLEVQMVVQAAACCPQVCLLTAEDVEMPGLTWML